MTLEKGGEAEESTSLIQVHKAPVVTPYPSKRSEEREEREVTPSPTTSSEFR